MCKGKFFGSKKAFREGIFVGFIAVEFDSIEGSFLPANLPLATICSSEHFDMAKLSSMVVTSDLN